MSIATMTSMIVNPLCDRILLNDEIFSKRPRSDTFETHNSTTCSDLRSGISDFDLSARSSENYHDFWRAWSGIKCRNLDPILES